MAVDLPLRLEGQAAAQAARSALGVVVAGRPGQLKADILLQGDPATISVRAGLFAPDVVRAIAADFSAFCNSFLGEPAAVLGSLPLGHDQAATAADGPGESADTVHALIARMAQDIPDAVAIEDGGRKLTYRELEERAAKLAGALAARGAGPGLVVGLYLDRSADLLVSMLAILKTGAAYLPLDPSYPADRIAFMIEDSAAALVVAYGLLTVCWKPLDRAFGWYFVPTGMPMAAVGTSWAEPHTSCENAPPVDPSLRASFCVVSRSNAPTAPRTMAPMPFLASLVLALCR